MKSNHTTAKFAAFLLSVTMASALFPATVLASENPVKSSALSAQTVRILDPAAPTLLSESTTHNVDSPSALTAALSSSSSGDTIRLSSNIVYANDIGISDKAITIDLSGFTLEMRDAAVFVNHTGSLTVMDSRSNGKLFATNSSSRRATVYLGRMPGSAGQIVGGGSFTLNSGTIEGGVDSTVYCYGGTVTVNDGSIIQTGSWDAIHAEKGCQVTVNGGRLSGKRAGINLQTNDHAPLSGTTVARVAGGIITAEKSGSPSYGVYTENTSGACELYLSGGTLIAQNGNAIYNQNRDGKFYLSGNPQMTPSAGQAAIYTAFANSIIANNGESTPVYYTGTGFTVDYKKPSPVNGDVVVSGLEDEYRAAMITLMNSNLYLMTKADNPYSRVISTINGSSQVVPGGGLGDVKSDMQDQFFSLLDDQDLQDALNGAQIDLTLYVGKMEIVTDAEKQEIDELMKRNGYQHGMYLDITLKKTVTPPASAPTTSTIYNTANDTQITIKVKLPEELLKPNRTYKVIRSHLDNGTLLTDVLDANLAEGRYLAFRSNEFSVFTIVYKDGVPSGPSKGGSTNFFSSYWITAEAGEGGAIAPAGETKYAALTDAVYTITPENGYVIDRVLIDGKSEAVLANNSYTFKSIDQPYSIKATFKKASPAPASTPEAVNPATGDSALAYYAVTMAGCLIVLLMAFVGTKLTLKKMSFRSKRKLGQK